MSSSSSNYLPVWTVSLLTGLFLVLIMAMNYAVNPVGIYPPKLFDPIVYASRADKVRLYYATDPRPDIVLLGSSRNFTVPPAYIEELTGLPAFNAAVQGGTPRDFLAFIRLMKDDGHLPRYVIVGLGTEQYLVDWTVVTYEPMEPLAPYLGEDNHSVRTFVLGFEGLISVEQTRASLRLVMSEIEGRSPLYFEFESDGRAIFTDPHPLQQALREYLAGPWAPAMFEFEQLDAVQLGYLRAMLEEAEGLGITVIMYLPPFHPTARQLYERESNYALLREQMLSELAELQREYGFTFYNFEDPSAYGGTSEMFNDAVHPTEEASRLMMEEMLRGLN